MTRAAEVVIRLYDSEGRALINVDVTAWLVESDPGNSERAPSAPFSPERWRLSSGVIAETDRSGAFTFPDLPPGVYALVLTARDDPFLLLPAADLRAPDALRITVPADQPRLEAPVVLRRGDLVLIDVTTNVAKQVLCSVPFARRRQGMR